VTDEPLSLREGPWGVNVVGCTNRDVEAEEAAPLVVSALDAQRIPALPIDVWSSRGGEGPYLSLDLKDAPFPVNVICLGPDTLPELGSQAGSELFAGRYSIGLWLWPLSTLPERLGRSSSLLEEVWAPSSHAARALEPLATVPVSPVRLPVQPAARSPRSRVDLGLPHDKFLFLFSFDYLSGFKRKNPLALVEAFRAAFADGEDTHLLLRCINAERDSRNHAQLVDAASSDPGIEVIDSDASGADTAALTALCDCYVSLHRAEAFGLDLATAMWHGKPVIATGYSGNLDFMTSENSMLVDYGLEPVGTSADPYPATAEWANPSVEHAAALMRRAFDDRAAAARLGARAAEDIRRTHSVQAAGEIMSRRLESIRATGRARRSADRLGERPPALARLSPHVRDGLSSGSRATGTRRALRKLVLRMMRPFTAYQQGVNSEVVSALDELNQRVAGLRREIAGERAELLAELRRYEELKRGSAD
jgi:glycosyltransferase involved in cell wall biosynthesis